MNKITVLSLLVAASTLAACEFAGNALAPSITGGPGNRTVQLTPIVPLDPAVLGQPSGTSAGIRVAQFRSDLAQLQQAGVQQIQRGRQLQADMDASTTSYQIAAGTIRSNPQGAPGSDAAWRNAQAQLQTVSVTLDQMSGLSNEVAKNVAYAAFLQQSVSEANAAPDATEQDRRQLAMLEQSTSQTGASLTQLLDGLRQEVLAQSHFLGTEGAKLAQLAPPSVAAPGNVAMSPQAASPQPAPEQSTHVAGAAGAGLSSGQPFVVIRFDNPGVQYEQQLYEAVSAALARSPDVAFDLVGVSPAAGASEDGAASAEAARQSMQKVKQSLLNMGLPADRISISQFSDPNVQTNEVHLYVR